MARNIYRKQTQLKVCTPMANLHVQPSGICHTQSSVLINADIES